MPASRGRSAFKVPEGDKQITNGLLTRPRPAVIMVRVMTGPYVLSTFALIALAALAGCGRPDSDLPIADLREIPQDCRAALGSDFIDKALISPDAQRQLAQAYRRAILSPWRDDYSPSSADEVREPFDMYARNAGCGENLSIFNQFFNLSYKLLV